MSQSRDLLATAALLGALVGSGASAQSDDAAVASDEVGADRPFELEPITVQGELQERTVQDTQTSVSVVTGEQLERRSDPDLYEVIGRLPNVTSSFGEQGFGIRGIDQRGVGGGGTGRVVSVEVDGVALPSNQATFFGPYSTWDLEQVEVLRGPQSTQQGRNALAGAIIVRSNDPTFEPEAKLRGEYGSRNSYRGAIALNLPLLEDTLAFRVAADTYHTDGWIENPTRNEDDHDAQDLSTARAKLRWDPIQDMSLVLSYSFTDNEAGEDVFDIENWPEQRLIFSNVDEREGSEHSIWGLRLEWDLDNPFTIESETSYYDSDYIRIEDFDGTAEPLGIFERDGTSEAFEQDLRVRFEYETVRGVFGVFYSDTESTNPSLQTADFSTVNGLLPPGVPPIPQGLGTFTRVFGFGSESENIAGFGEADIDIGAIPGLTITAGLRFDQETVSEQTTEMTVTEPAAEDLPPPFNDIVPLLIPAQSAADNERDFDAWLPKIGVTYGWADEITTGFTVQRGYRAGGSQTNFFTGETNDFDPEFVWNYELSFRGQFFARRLTTNANLFYLDWQDQQVAVLGPSGNLLDQNTVNAGSSRVWGAEASLDAAVTPALDAFLAVGYARSEFIDFEEAGQDFSGNRFPNSPQWTGAFGGQYYLPNGVSVGADASYTDSSFSDAGNDPRNESNSVFLVNAQVGYEWRGLTAAFYARNLFDVDYITFRSFDGSVGEEQTVIRAGEPRTVGGFVQWEF